MKEHIIIGKFLRIWLLEKSIVWLIDTTWKQKYHYDVRMGSKVFFMVVFNILEYKDGIFVNGPYLFNSVELYLSYWKRKFTLEKEELSSTLVCILLYSLWKEYYDLETLYGLGNTLGSVVKASNVTLAGNYTSYAQIYVHVNISKEFPQSIFLAHENYDWLQTFDFDHIPYHSIKFHEHGKLFKDFPLDLPTSRSKGTKLSS